jgi:hypothetical protein
MGSYVEGAIPLAVVGLNRRTNSFVMCGSSALGHGGTSATAMRCWHFAAPSITVPSIGYLNAIDSDFERRKNHRMLLFGYPQAHEDDPHRAVAYLHAAGNSPGLKTEYNAPLSHHEKGALR